jgi:hypothetical protein
VNCPNCGTSNLDTASICANCGRPLNAPPPPPPPPASPVSTYTPPSSSQRPAGFGAPPPVESIPNYLVQSILVTLCCCLPFGIVAIIFASQVNSKLAAGDVAGAREASANARKWCWIAFGVGIVIGILSMIFNGAVFLQAIREQMANQ